MNDFFVIFLTAFFINTILEIIREKILPEEELKKIREKSQEIGDKLKKASIEDKQKIIEENMEFYAKIWNKNLQYMLIVMLIVIPTIYILLHVYNGKIIIPLPFKNPITGKYGLGPLATYIISSLISGIIIKLFKNIYHNYREKVKIQNVIKNR